MLFGMFVSRDVVDGVEGKKEVVGVVNVG